MPASTRWRLDDLSPLLDILFDEGVTKVMHSGRQDLEIFYHLAGKLPSPVFDTQIAALMLGYPEQVGYASLVKDELGIELDKLHTRADWSLRPLSRRPDSSMRRMMSFTWWKSTSVCMKSSQHRAGATGCLRIFSG